MIKVLIVEDSRVVSEYLQFILSNDPAIEVIGTAENGKKAIDFIQRHKPDIITMDIDMPVMGGFEATKEIMMTNPVPILVVTASKNAKEVKISMEAMAVGALGVIEKPLGFGHPEEAAASSNLINLVKVLSGVKVVRRHDYKKKTTTVTTSGKRIVPQSDQYNIVAIGVSSGGPQVLLSIFSKLTSDFPFPILVVQHIASGFLGGLVSWLDENTSIDVKIASDHEEVKSGTIYFAPDNYQMGVSRTGRIRLNECQNSSRLCPSVSYMFESVSEFYGKSAIAIMLTGMGSDGAVEMKSLSDKGALTIAQDKESSMIFGMPNEAIKLGGVKQVLSTEDIALLLSELKNR